MSDYGERIIDLNNDDLARIHQVEEELGINPVDVLHAALTGSTTSTGEPGMILNDGTDLPFIAPYSD